MTKKAETAKRDEFGSGAWAGDLETQPAPEPAPEQPSEVTVEPIPGEVGYDWASHYDTDDLYIHTFPDGTVVALRAFGKIFTKMWLFKMSELKTEIDLEIAAVKRGACPEAWTVLMGLDDSIGGDDLFEQLWDGWTGLGTGDGSEGLTAKN